MVKNTALAKSTLMTIMIHNKKKVICDISVSSESMTARWFFGTYCKCMDKIYTMLMLYIHNGSVSRWSECVKI